MTTFFWCAITRKICADFTFIKFYFRCFRFYFLLYTGSVSNPLLILLLTLFYYRMLLHVFSKSSSFIKKDTYLDSLKLSAYSLIFGSIIYNGLTFSSFLYPIKYLKPFFTKRNLFRYYYFIKMYILYVDGVFEIKKVPVF